GFVLSFVAILGLFILLKRSGIAWRVALKRTVIPLVVVLALAAITMGYYNWRVFGSPLTMPYQVNRTTYGVSPAFVFQRLAPAPVYRHDVMKRFYLEF